MRSRRLTAVDTAWLRMEEPRNAVDVTAVLVFDGHLPDDRLRALLHERLLVHARFAQRVRDARLGIGRPRWEAEPGFTLDAHLHGDALPAPGGRAELEALVARWMNRPFDWSRSPWRLVRVEGHQRGTALVAQLHHCMGDGFALVDVLLSLGDDRGPAPRPRRRPPLAARWVRGGLERLGDAPRIARDATADLARLLALSFDTPSALRGPLSGTRRAAWSEPIALARVKTLAHAQGCTVNDLLTSALTGALRRYLVARGDRVDELAIRAIVPINLRPAGVPIDLDHGNWFGLVFVDLPIAARDPTSRLAAIHATVERIKQSQLPLVSLVILNALGRIPQTIGRPLDLVFARKSSLVVTNVPGPTEVLRLAGVPLREIVFWVPHPARLALGISILSYAGEIRVGARSDIAVIADPERIVAHFEDELRALEAAIGSPGRARAGARRELT